MDRPFVSVLIDTYNHERFIEQAVVSVVEQDFPRADREIIVVDDGSTDRTAEILRKFEPQLRVIWKPNGGQASAFNAGIPECRGEIIAFLDGDDWWAPAKLTRVTAAFSQNPECGIVGHGIIIVHRDGSHQTDILRKGFQFQANTLFGARLLQRRGAFLGTSRMTLRTELLKRIGAVPEEIWVQADEYIFTIAAALHPVDILPEALTFYRLHDANNFLLANDSNLRLHRKMTSLDALASGLARRVEDLGIAQKIARILVEFADTSATQLRLALEGGWPWETLQTEWRIYKITYPDAPFSHRLFKALTLLAALATTPRGYYAAQRAIARSQLYARARQRWLPVPRMEHIERSWRPRT